MLFMLTTAAVVMGSCPGEWVDVHSPGSACTTASGRDGAPLSLVFSDEFYLSSRTFGDGHDSRWTALDLAPTTNEQINYYNSSLAFTQAGNLVLRTTSDDVVIPGTTETRHLQTAMLQTWNKFCFSEGAAEIRAQLPGRSNQAGLWPAFWLMGNLGRATFTDSTDGIWPYVFDECVSATDADCEANQCTAQRISACDANPGHGLNPHQGRGSPEIDVIEVQPGEYVNEYATSSYWASLGCAAPDQPTSDAVRMTQPFVSTSLQAAPGMPRDAIQRPQTGCVPQRYVNVSGQSAVQWYPELSILAPGSASSSYTVGTNYEFWGEVGLSPASRLSQTPCRVMRKACLTPTHRRDAPRLLSYFPTFLVSPRGSTFLRTAAARGCRQTRSR